MEDKIGYTKTSDDEAPDKTEKKKKINIEGLVEVDFAKYLIMIRGAGRFEALDIIHKYKDYYNNGRNAASLFERWGAKIEDYKEYLTLKNAYGPKMFDIVKRRMNYQFN